MVYAPDGPRVQGYNYQVMRDVHDLLRNRNGDRMFPPDSIPEDRYFVTPSGHVLSRCGRKGEDPNYPGVKSLVRVGYVSVKGYCEVGLSWKEGNRSRTRFIGIHLLVYAAFGDISVWNGERLDHMDGRRSNNDVHNLKPSSAQSDALAKQDRLHWEDSEGGFRMKNNRTGESGLQRLDRGGYRIHIKQNGQTIHYESLKGDEYGHDEDGLNRAKKRVKEVREELIQRGLLNPPPRGGGRQGGGGSDGSGSGRSRSGREET